MRRSTPVRLLAAGLLLGLSGCVVPTDNGYSGYASPGPQYAPQPYYESAPLYIPGPGPGYGGGGGGGYYPPREDRDRNYRPPDDHRYNGSGPDGHRPDDSHPESRPREQPRPAQYGAPPPQARPASPQARPGPTPQSRPPESSHRHDNDNGH